MFEVKGDVAELFLDFTDNLLFSPGVRHKEIDLFRRIKEDKGKIQFILTRCLTKT